MSNDFYGFKEAGYDILEWGWSKTQNAEARKDRIHAATDERMSMCLLAAILAQQKVLSSLLEEIRDLIDPEARRRRREIQETQKTRAASHERYRRWARRAGRFVLKEFVEARPEFRNIHDDEHGRRLRMGIGKEMARIAAWFNGREDRGKRKLYVRRALVAIQSGQFDKLPGIGPHWQDKITNALRQSAEED